MSARVDTLVRVLDRVTSDDAVLRGVVADVAVLDTAAGELWACVHNQAVIIGRLEQLCLAQQGELSALQSECASLRADLSVVSGAVLGGVLVSS